MKPMSSNNVPLTTAPPHPPSATPNPTLIECYQQLCVGTNSILGKLKLFFTKH